MNVKKEVERIIEFIRDYYKKNNLKGAVIGISGGKDSGVVAGLFKEAIGSENILGVTMPIESKEEDRLDAMLIADKFGFEIINIDLTDTYHTLISETNKLNPKESDLVDSNINVKPRLRMSTLYYLAAYYSHLKGGTYIVAGTGNKCEMFVGYFTKSGDGVSDINVLGDLTVDEVIKIGEYLGVPDKVLYKTPSDGLSGKSDEDKLGVKYKDIEKFINGEKLDEETYKKIDDLHKKSLHKFNIPTYKKSDSL